MFTHRSVYVPAVRALVCELSTTHNSEPSPFRAFVVDTHTHTQPYSLYIPFIRWNEILWHITYASKSITRQRSIDNESTTDPLGSSPDTHTLQFVVLKSMRRFISTNRMSYF